MYRLACLALGLLALALASLPADAGNGCNVQRAVVTQHRTAYATTNYAASAAYVAPVASYSSYATSILAVPVIVPAYGVGYGSPDNSKDVADLKSLVLLQQQQLILLQQQLLAKPAPVPTAPVAPEPLPPPLPKKADAKAPAPGLATARNCAGCHDAGVSKAKGGEFTLFVSGQPVPLNPVAALNAVDQVLTSAMPKGREMADSDATLVLAELVKWPLKK
jgi:hypothetical protein